MKNKDMGNQNIVIRYFPADNDVSRLRLPFLEEASNGDRKEHRNRTDRFLSESVLLQNFQHSRFTRPGCPPLLRKSGSVLFSALYLA